MAEYVTPPPVLTDDEVEAIADQWRAGKLMYVWAHGMARQIERAVLLKLSIPRPKAVPWQGGLSNEELRREWDLRLPGVEPTARELSAFAVGIEAGHKIVWVHDPSLDHAREAMRMALAQLEAARDESVTKHEFEARVLSVIEALTKALGEE
jgi:hypothetical protein